jgi:hypothetical protein
MMSNGADCVPTRDLAAAQAGMNAGSFPGCPPVRSGNLCGGVPGSSSVTGNPRPSAYAQCATRGNVRPDACMALIEQLAVLGRDSRL